MEKKDEDRLRMFNLLAEAKLNALVEMVKRYYPPDQVKQFCEVMLERALKNKGVV